jgi:hypothetical protein
MIVLELADVAIVALSLATERDRILRTVETISPSVVHLVRAAEAAGLLIVSDWNRVMIVALNGGVANLKLCETSKVVRCGGTPTRCVRGQLDRIQVLGTEQWCQT